jgi:hypothetical protein
MKAEKALLLVAFILICVALVAGVTGGNPANSAKTTTGTVHAEGAGTNTQAVLSEGEFSSSGGDFTFTGTLLYK